MKNYLHLGQSLSDGTPFALPVSAYDRHAHYLGPTGTGKTYALLCTAQELIADTDAAVFFLDVKGSAARRLERWCYQRGLDDRLLPINPNDPRMVCGFNPVAPWPDNQELQARVARELFLRAIGQTEALLTPRNARWLDNLTYALIKLKLTLAEALLLFDYSTNAYRRALVPLLPEGTPVRSDFEWLVKVADHGSQAQMLKILDEHLGAAVNRLRHVLGNPALRAMYGAGTTIDIRTVIDERMIVPINLQPRQLDREAQRLLGLQLINEIVREVFRRKPVENVPVYLIIDEAHMFMTPDLAECLDLGRELGMRVILANQFLSQFRDRITGDSRMLDSVMTDAKLKVIFGALSPGDAEEMTRMLWGHHLNPDKRRTVSWSPRQLQRVITGLSQTRGTSEGESLSAAIAHTRAEGESRGSTRSVAIGTSSGRAISSLFGVGSASGSFVGSATTEGTNAQGLEGLDAITHSATLSSAFSDVDSDFHADGESQTETASEAESFAESSSRFTMDSQTISSGVSSNRGSSESVTQGPMVVPGPMFLEPQVEFEALEVQLARHQAALILQHDRHAVVVQGKQLPVAMRWKTLHEAAIDDHEADQLTLERMRDRQEYSEPDAVQALIAERHRRLLIGGDSHTAVLDDSRAELERNLAAATKREVARRCGSTRTKRTDT
jgi:type IV secretory system conjugative DNA transfer VirD4/TraG family protein